MSNVVNPSFPCLYLGAKTMFKFSFNREVASVCFMAASVCVLIVIIGIRPIGSQNPQNQNSDGKFHDLTRVKKMLEKEGVTIADLKNDKGLRSEWLPQLREMRDKREIEGNLSETSFYGVIVTNNLFRPLGYEKPRQGRSFQLVATVIDSKNGKSKALVQNNRNRRIHYVTVGEAFADARVKRIEPKSITLLLDEGLKEFHLPQGALLGPMH